MANIVLAKPHQVSLRFGARLEPHGLVVRASGATEATKPLPVGGFNSLEIDDVSGFNHPK